MNPDAPTAYGPGPHEINNGIIDALHNAIRVHPSVQAKAAYGQMLAQALRQQATAHQAHGTAVQHAVHQPAPPPSSGGGYASGQGLAPADNADPSGGYIAENISPILAALIRSGGFQNAGSLPHFNGPEGGLLGAVLAQHATPHLGWAA